jgi:hypothetical protein
MQLALATTSAQLCQSQLAAASHVSSTMPTHLPCYFMIPHDTQRHTACRLRLACGGRLSIQRRSNLTNSGGHMSALQRHRARYSTAQRGDEASTSSYSQYSAAQLASPASAMQLRRRTHCSELRCMVQGTHCGCTPRNCGKHCVDYALCTQYVLACTCFHSCMLLAEHVPL